MFTLKRLFIFIVAIFLISIIVVFAVNIVVYAGAKAYIYDEIEKAPDAQTAIILGASVLPSRKLSPILKDRVDTAIKLYESKKVSKILVSGDNGTLTYNEVDPVRIYLLNKGILDEDIFLDHAGFDTHSTMYRARDIFKVDSVLIVSQSFHLPRAVFIARWLGIDAYGVNADGGHIRLSNYIREIFANEKAILYLILDIKPKYLGTQIPITGDGRNSP